LGVSFIPERIAGFHCGFKSGSRIIAAVRSSKGEDSNEPYVALAFLLAAM